MNEERPAALEEKFVENVFRIFDHMPIGINFVDENGNNKWDTGNYAAKQQAESVYYFPFKFTLRAFWEVEENWDYKALPLLKQKPEELIKSSTNKKKNK